MALAKAFQHPSDILNVRSLQAVFLIDNTNHILNKLFCGSTQVQNFRLIETSKNNWIDSVL